LVTRPIGSEIRPERDNLILGHAARAERAAAAAVRAAFRNTRRFIDSILYAWGELECYTIRITMRFEWDSRKDRINQTKHSGLDFETAARVFDDPNVVLLHDRVIDGEQRWFAIGAVSSALLLVVHVYSEDDINGEETIRIISAREANQRERRTYIQQAAQ